MPENTTVAVDLSKAVFQVHAADGAGRPVLRKKLRRSQMVRFFSELPPCLVGMEACASAHHWARRLQALGHEVRLVPPHYVKPFVKTNKNDSADAAAVARSTVAEFERGARQTSARQTSARKLAAMQSAMEKAGVIFIAPNGGGPGVRLKRS